MARTLVHRGPDDGGIWVDAEAGIGLGHRRLSILDLSSAGHQPMTSSCGRHVIVFNGEIYNFLEVKKELLALGHSFRGSSDTEVLLEGIARWGVRDTLKRVNGMFAFAVWDRQGRSLTLARDHVGIKPLYYGWTGNTLLFASELKALRVHPNFEGKVERDAVALFFKYNYVPAPYCILRNFHKLPAGHFIVLESPQIRRESESYLSVQDVIERGEESSMTDQEAIEGLERLLRDAVRQQMVADVPLGAFLSGGIDSSTVVALMQSQLSSRVKTFSIGFHEKEYDEAGHARKVANHLGTEHTELFASPDDALGVVPQLAAMFDEPFADPSQIPTFLVAQLTRRHVTVSLSGDGGDELFAGYSHYLSAKRRWALTRMVPSTVRSFIAARLRAPDEYRWDSLISQWRFLVPRRACERVSGYRIRRFADSLETLEPAAFYQNQVSKWNATQNLVLNARECPLPFAAPRHIPPEWGVIQSMVYFDLLNYLPEDVLTKVDRTTMAVSLEARVPLLDYRLVEFATKLAMPLKIRGGQGKWVLRQILYKYVPQELVDRPKMGFDVPIKAWLRGPLKAWAEQLLRPKDLEEDGYFASELIRRKWVEHVDGRRDWSQLLWIVIMFQAWKKQWGL